MYSSIFFAFFLPYLHNIPYTKNVYFHTCTLDLHVFQISLVYFFLLYILQNLIHSFLAESLPAYVCDPDILLLSLYVLLFFYITCSIYLLYPALALHILSFSYILVQILYDTYNSTLVSSIGYIFFSKKLLFLRSRFLNALALHLFMVKFLHLET